MPPLPRRLLQAALLTVAALLASPLAMLAWLHASVGDRIVSDPAVLPPMAEACVMGARVYGPGDPSPVALQRVEAAAALAATQAGVVFVVSGHEPANAEASELAAALVARGVAPDRVRVDPFGNSTLANVRAPSWQPVVFITQGYHLPRTLWMARQQGMDAWGLAAEAVAPTDPGAGRLEVAVIRTRRHLREGALGVVHLLGAYELLAKD